MRLSTTSGQQEVLCYMPLDSDARPFITAFAVGVTSLVYRWGNRGTESALQGEEMGM